jgi:hypothetical protein
MRSTITKRVVWKVIWFEDFKIDPGVKYFCATLCMRASLFCRAKRINAWVVAKISPFIMHLECMIRKCLTPIMQPNISEMKKPYSWSRIKRLAPQEQIGTASRLFHALAHGFLSPKSRPMIYKFWSFLRIQRPKTDFTSRADKDLSNSARHRKCPRIIPTSVIPCRIALSISSRDWISLAPVFRESE